MTIPTVRTFLLFWLRCLRWLRRLRWRRRLRRLLFLPDCDKYSEYSVYTIMSYHVYWKYLKISKKIWKDLILKWFEIFDFFWKDLKKLENIWSWKYLKRSELYIDLILKIFENIWNSVKAIYVYVWKLVVYTKSTKSLPEKVICRTIETSSLLKYLNLHQQNMIFKY